MGFVLDSIRLCGVNKLEEVFLLASYIPIDSKCSRILRHERI